MKKSDIFNKGLAVGLSLKPLYVGEGGAPPTPPITDPYYIQETHQFRDEYIGFERGVAR